MSTRKIGISTFSFTLIEQFAQMTYFFFLWLGNLFSIRFISLPAFRIIVNLPKIAIPRGYHDPRNVHFHQVCTDTCSERSEISITIGHEQCRTTLAFPVSEVFDKGGKNAPKGQKEGFYVRSPSFGFSFRGFSYL